MARLGRWNGKIIMNLKSGRETNFRGLANRRLAFPGACKPKYYNKEKTPRSYLI
jgi:hypothetical protein